MILDPGKGDTLPAQVDFCVIGGGTIGLPIALELSRATKAPVLCLESGEAAQEADTHPLHTVEHEASEYAGAQAGRFRGLGGTSARWGGALIPFQPADMARWPVASEDLAPFLSQVETMFGLDAGEYAPPGSEADLGPDLSARLAKWPPFAKRNVASLLRDDLDRSENCRVALNTTVTGIEPGDDGVILTVATPDRMRSTLVARRVIIAAGAIETTRLALLLDRTMDGAVRRVSPSLGQYFSDHLSIAIGQIDPADRAALNHQFGFRFAPSGMMRNLRFELADGSGARGVVPPGFVHIGYETDGTGGFDHLRDAMQSIQRRKVPGLRTIAGLARHAPWLVRAIAWRYRHKRQLFPDRADLVAHGVIEQIPDAANRITLSEQATDAFGTPLPAIRWQVGQRDIANMNILAELFEREWKASPLHQAGTFARFEPAQIEDAVRHSGGIYHPTGSTRMGTSAADGVVDADLRLFAEPRIQLCSTSVLPSGGGANPTMTALLLAMRLVAQHARPE
ncbi:GMC oxidoreductase [Parerythrobacter jejuensis]|uniref:Glucose-methanol-choline oxidoreductase C-terminal domain-containing protein n=1 Tax=Parerythrobacter jejuensis TaxID=795812 RepID=A0A845AJF4_9SPHN|nr:GMC oxidoreductase [Parerythrobacter jejuensis]MXP30380.1 hypothetical protein [Parerythrobacter jejuensis]MXP33140.1 hypothetical protein [Parerythrobacter jejuensis]